MTAQGDHTARGTPMSGAGRLASAGVDTLKIRLDTGSVRVPLTPERGETKPPVKRDETPQD